MAKTKARAAATRTRPAAKAKRAAPARPAKKEKPKGALKEKAKGASKGAAKSARAGARKAAAARPAKDGRKDLLDFGEFPPGAVTHRPALLCLACIFRLFTEQLGLAPRTAYTEIRRYAPAVAELSAKEPQRPFFAPPQEKNPRCPYCDAARRWHARLDLYRVEGGKQTDQARRALVKRLPKKDEQFVVTEEKRTAREVFFDWLERLGQGLDFEDEEGWMMRAARAYLERHDPKADWAGAFEGAARVRRSQRIEEGWERDGARLFLAPSLYKDVLLVQYLVSRSHRHGGRTFEGRLTLPELVWRVRPNAGPDGGGPVPSDRFDALEQHVERLSGGDQTVKLHYILDRRDLLDKARDAYARG